METAVRWSQKSIAGNEKFLYVEVVGKSFKLCRIKSKKNGVLQYEVISEHKKVPIFRAFDWSPTHEGIVAVGQSSGEATVLRIDDGSQATLSFSIRTERHCNAVALNTQGLLAAGLDKVRTDHCLNVWDLQQQLPSGNTPGFPRGRGRNHPEPLHKLASSEAISSLKFFQSEPQTLVAGVKGQFLRQYDLRESPGAASIQFSTRCVHNMAIDSMDENYFASCYPSNNPVICVWDRRAGSRPPMTQTSFFTESTALHASLELRNAAETGGMIWSLRFSNTRRGCLGMLSSNGHFKTYDIGKEYQERDPGPDDGSYQTSNQTIDHPEELYLNGIQDLQHAYNHPKEGRSEAERIVSFDFMNLGGTWNEPKVITLTGSGRVAELSIPMEPEPEVFSSIGLIHKGRVQMQQPSDLVTVLLGRSPNSLPATKVKPADSKSPGASAITIQYLRCLHGYLFSLKKNRTLCSETPQLKNFWSWVEWANKGQSKGNTIQDDLDLSYLGVHALWMDDLGPRPHKSRTLSDSSVDMPKVTENLVQRISVPATRTCATDYEFHRRLCLHALEQAWTYEQLEKSVDDLLSQGQFTKAAAIAFFAEEDRLGYRALRSSSQQFHKMLAMAVMSSKIRVAGKDEENSEWGVTIHALATGLSDPFAKAILSYVKENTWEAVLREDNLPLSYRIGVAVRWLSDSALSQYISKTTREVVLAGNIEGIVLAGLGTKAGFELLENYARNTGDLQTAVLALTWTIPRYIDDPAIKRRFLTWREVYRDFMISWNLPFNRVDFDIISSRIAVDANGKRLLETAKPQVALTCGYCNQSLAQFKGGVGNVDTAPNNHRTPPQRYPLTGEKAAAIGTVCPKCGRRLPRCGVCDMELGTPDPSYLKWSARSQHLGSVDLSASIGGSVITTLGPGISGSKTNSDRPGLTPSKAGSDPPDAKDSRLSLAAQDSNRLQSSSDLTEGARPSQEPGLLPSVATQDFAQTKAAELEMFRRLIAFCIKCNHGSHANHAIEWFRGVNGRPGHSVCPVSECSCVCDV